jgi:hypothetical protein
MTDAKAGFVPGDPTPWILMEISCPRLGRGRKIYMRSVEFAGRDLTRGCRPAPPPDFASLPAR